MRGITGEGEDEVVYGMTVEGKLGGLTGVWHNGQRKGEDEVMCNVKDGSEVRARRASGKRAGGKGTME